MSSKSFLIILSYTVSKSVRFLRHSVWLAREVETRAYHISIISRGLMRVKGLSPGWGQGP